MPRTLKSHGAALFLCAALMYTVLFPDPVIAQPQPPGPIRYVTADPTGQACTAKSIALRTPAGTLFTCKNGVYAASGSTGTVTSIATTAPITGGTITGTGTIALNVAVDHAFTAAQSVTLAALGATTQTAGATLANGTAATVGAQQQSPCLILTGSGWGTTAPAAQTVDWCIRQLPVQGAAAPSSALQFYSRVNAGAWTEQLDVTSAGAVFATGNLSAGGTVSSASNSLISARANIGAYQVTGVGGGMEFVNTGGAAVPTGGLFWDGTTQFTADLGLTRSASGVLAVGTGALGSTAGNVYSGGLNFGTTETGANNAIACAAGCGPALKTGLVVTILLAHTLQAGANTFAYIGGGALNIKSHRNTANNIAAAYASGSLVQLGYDGTQWQDMSQ